MKATVELVYEDETKNRRVTVFCKGKGVRLVDSIDKAVVKQESADKDWIRWNLISVDD
jgi:hypothetical protein